MIISHKYKFIFIKTAKVGGSSLEIALSKHLGPQDVITPLAEESWRQERGFRTCQNFRKNVGEIDAADILQFIETCLVNIKRSVIYKRFRFHRGGWPRKFDKHMPARLVRERIGKDVWNSYFKFSIERNPWDLVVSYYYYWTRHNEDMDFDKFLKSGMAVLASNFDMYTVDGEPVLDRVIRYEDMEAELTKISCRIGFPENIFGIINDIRAKSHIRNIQGYQELYDEELRTIVAKTFSREISMFGYEF